MKRYKIKLKKGHNLLDLSNVAYEFDNLDQQQLVSFQFKIGKAYSANLREKDLKSDFRIGELLSLSEGKESQQLTDSESELERLRKDLALNYVIEVDDLRASQVFVELSSNVAVDSIEVDEICEEYYRVDDPLYVQLWGLSKIQCIQAWDHTMGSGVLVAVVDSGIDVVHNDLNRNIFRDSKGNYGFNTMTDDFNIGDDTGHGTHVAGTIGAIVNNSTGITGVAPHCKILPVRSLKGGKGYLTDLLDGILLSVDLGAKVVNNSWGPGNRINTDADKVLRVAYLSNVNIVFAAGNNNREINPSAIATYPTVVSVASVDLNDNKSAFSNYGQYVTLSAPGSSILSTIPGGNYAFKSGTSMAAPHVSGVIALMLSKNPTLSPADVKQILVNSCDPIDDSTIGAGRLNAFKAIQLC